MLFRTIFLSILICFLCFHDTYCQNQKEADSLLNVYRKSEKLSDSVRTELLYLIAIKSTQPEDMVKYSDKLIEISKEYKPTYYKIQAYNIKGSAYRFQGNLESALDYLFRSAKLAKDNNYFSFEAEAYSEIANTYLANDDYGNALEYQNKAISIFRKEKVEYELSIALLNAGFNYYSVDSLQKALVYYNEAIPIFDRIEMAIGKAYAVGNRALVYWKQGNTDQAIADLNHAINMLKPLGDQYGMADYHNQLASIYFEQNQSELAIVHAQQSTTMAKELGLKEQLRDGYLLLSKLYHNQDKHQQAFNYQSLYIIYKDSLANAEQTKEIANIRTDFEVSLRETTIDNLRKKEALNTTYIIIAVILLALSIILLMYLRQRLKTSKLISEREKQQQDDQINHLLQTQETKVLQSMIEGRDGERKRLANELHNHLGSLLATIKVNINGIDETAIKNHQTLLQLIDQACNDVRNMSHTLNMGVSENFGLIPALKELTHHLNQPDIFEVEFSVSMCEGILDSDIEIVSYRIIQELLSNIMKHAQATKVSVQLTCFGEDHLINILVQDNGSGFDTEQSYEGMGLKSIQQMVSSYKGEVFFDSNASSGTTVTIDLPLVKHETL